MSTTKIGNLTSQLFANIYMNRLDHWAKHMLKTKYYIRYADDFVFLSTDKNYLKKSMSKIQEFLQNSLKLSLHPHKVILKTIASGIDFLGWVHFPDHRVLRNKTRQHMFRRIKDSPTESTLQSYLGLLSHGNTEKLQQEVIGEWWLWKS